MPLKELKQKLLIKKHICYSANLFALVSFQLTVQVFFYALLPLVGILVSPFSALCCVNISSYQ